MNDKEQGQTITLANAIAEAIVNAGSLDDTQIQSIISQCIRQYCSDSTDSYKALYEINSADVDEGKRKGLTRLVCEKAGLTYYE